jgi:hypothetical protein
MTFHLGLGRNPPTRIHEDPIFWPHRMRLPSVNEPGPFSRVASMPAAKHVGSLAGRAGCLCLPHFRELQPEADAIAIRRFTTDDHNVGRHWPGSAGRKCVVERRAEDHCHVNHAGTNPPRPSPWPSGAFHGWDAGFQCSRHGWKRVEMRFANSSAFSGSSGCAAQLAAEDEFTLAAIAQNLQARKTVARPPAPVSCGSVCVAQCGS